MMDTRPGWCTMMSKAVCVFCKRERGEYSEFNGETKEKEKRDRCIGIHPRIIYTHHTTASHMRDRWRVWIPTYYIFSNRMGQSMAWLIIRDIYPPWLCCSEEWAASSKCNVIATVSDAVASVTYAKCLWSQCPRAKLLIYIYKGPNHSLFATLVFIFLAQQISLTMVHQLGVIASSTALLWMMAAVEAQLSHLK